MSGMNRLKFQVSGFKFQVSYATWADISKAGRLLSWKPETNPADGFRRRVAWYAEHRELVREIKI